MIQSWLVTAKQESDLDYSRTVEALKEAGLSIFTIEPKSLAQMLLDEEYAPYLGYINPLDVVRNYIPMAADLAVGLGLSKDRFFKGGTSLPNRNIYVRKPYAVEACQLDIAYQKLNQGKKLFPDFWIKILDEIPRPHVVYVGRSCPEDKLGVPSWVAHSDILGVVTFSVVEILHQ